MEEGKGERHWSVWEELNPPRVIQTGSAPTYFAQFRLLLGSGSEKGHFLLPSTLELEQAEVKGHKRERQSP